MNRWIGSKSWAFVLSFLIFAGGMLFFTGYLSNLYFFSQERAPIITHETDQALSASIQHNPDLEETVLLRQNQTGKINLDDKVIVSDTIKNDQEIQRKQTLQDFPCPVQGTPLRSVGNYYSEAFDSYLFHAGMDYAEPEGTMIRATHGGKVIFSGADPILGQKVTVDCGDGWLVTYGGLDNLRVQVGEIVEIQDALGQVGFIMAPEGESNQPQLHYEVWHGDEIQVVQGKDWWSRSI